MYWEEDEVSSNKATSLVTDISFGIKCHEVPVDHAWLLQQSLLKLLPWLSDEPLAGIHNIHISESGNGWCRPNNPDVDILLLSKRSKLKIRIPTGRIADARQLIGQTTEIAGASLEILKCRELPLAGHSALFARHIILRDNESEADLISRTVPQLEERLGCKIKKVLCGKINQINTPAGQIKTQSMMIADLKKHEAIKLQETGAETGGSLLGCGLFIPHKDIKPVKE